MHTLLQTPQKLMYQQPQPMYPAPQPLDQPAPHRQGYISGLMLTIMFIIVLLFFIFVALLNAPWHIPTYIPKS